MTTVRVTPPYWINAALRSVIWFGAAVGFAYFSKPDDASLLAVRTDAVGWLGAVVVFAAVAVHVWSNVRLAQGERRAAGGIGELVMDGPFGYVRHPIYLAGITLLFGVGLLYPAWQPEDLILPLLLLAYFHLSVVVVEEPALRRQFGETYGDYSSRVRRWLPLPASPRRTARGDDAGHPRR